MDHSILDLVVFLSATFVAALVAGLAGFAFGLVAAAIWLHVLTPAQTATLIVCFGLLVQGIAIWKLRRSLDWSVLWPFFLGGMFGVPLGVLILGWANPQHMRVGIGAVLIAYSIYSLARPALKPVQPGAAMNASVGFLNGMLGGATGLAGIIVTIWCGRRGFAKDRQRAIFQPVAVATFAMSVPWLGAQGAFSADIVKLGIGGLPFALAGTWLGLRLYDRIDEAGFRRIVLLLLLISGLSLIVSGAWLLAR